jgi:hypothetical protein
MKTLPILFALLVFGGCDRVKHAAKTTLRKTSETVGQSATVVADGLATGAQKEAVQVQASPALQGRGLELGKASLSSADSSGVQQVQLTMYVVFQQNFADTVRVKLFTRQGAEYGRSKVWVQGARDNARPIVVRFDPRTETELGTKVTLD